MGFKLTPKTVAGGAAVYFATAVGAYLYLRGQKAKEGEQASSTSAASGGEQRRGPGELAKLDSHIWSGLAARYDAEIDRDETAMGLKLLRWWLIRQAKGDVLEVSAGTGRNLKYYDLTAGGKVSSLTISDSNKEMLQTAYDKFRGMKLDDAGAPVRFTLADAQMLGQGDSTSSSSEAGQPQQPSFGPQVVAPEGFQPGQFDTVVDTFGLCSCDDPVGALQAMARVVKPGGQLLLLEHGRGTWNWVNGILNAGEERHCQKWGCQWNRPIDELVAKAGLEVDSMSRWHFGTTYAIKARPAAEGRDHRQPEQDQVA